MSKQIIIATILSASVSAVSLRSDPICSSAGCTEYKPAPDAHPMDYFVPDFGVDHTIIQSLNDIKVAEAIRGEKWTWKKQEKKPDAEPYKVPDFGLDQDIIGVNDGLAWAQKELGHEWKPVQDKDGYWMSADGKNIS